MATVKAHDVDSDDNGRITYTLDSSQTETEGQLFHVDSHTGQMTVVEVLTHAHTAIYHLSIIATDQGNPATSCTASLNVIVGHAAAQRVMTSRVGVSVYVTSAVCVGCFLLASFLLVVAIVRRRRRHGNRHQHHHHHQRLESSISQHETAHILPSYVRDKSRPLRDLEPAALREDFPARRLQVTRQFSLCCSRIVVARFRMFDYYKWKT